MDSLNLVLGCTKSEQINLIIQSLLALLTFLAVCVAIINSTKRFGFLSPTFRLKCDLSDAEFNKNNNDLWIHLKLAYVPRTIRLPYVLSPPATNCRVMLRSVGGNVIDSGYWSKNPVVPTMQFCWPFERDGIKSPQQVKPSYRNIAVNETFHVDFMELKKYQDETGEGWALVPTLYNRDLKFGENSTEFGVKPDDYGNYEIYCVCDHLTTKCQTFRVSWDGKYPGNREDIPNHFRIENTPPWYLFLFKRVKTLCAEPFQRAYKYFSA